MGESGNYVLEMKDIVKIFPGVRALDGVTLRVRPGSVHVIVGENGAGKSTLMKIISGEYVADGGEMIYKGSSVGKRTIMETINMGISMIAQELNYVSELSVEENLFLGRLPVTRLGRVDWKKVRREARRFLKEEGLSYAPDQKLKTLTVSDIQMLEITKAITNNAQIIIMDEPTSSIT